MNINY